MRAQYNVWTGQPDLKSPGWDRVEYRLLEAVAGNNLVINQEREERRRQL